MARNRHRNRIRRTRPGHAPHRARGTDAARNVRVAGGGTRRNIAQRLPDALLERGPPDIERKIETEPWSLDQPDHCRDIPFEVPVAAGQSCLRKSILEFLKEGIRVVAQKDRAHACLGRSHENGAEPALANGEPHQRACAPVAEASRRHAESPRRARVEPPAGIEASAIHRLGHRGPMREFLAYASRAVGHRVRPW